MLLATLLYLAAWLWCTLLAVRLRIARDGVEAAAFGMAGAIGVVCWGPFLAALVLGMKGGAWFALAVLVALAVREVALQRTMLRRLDEWQPPRGRELLRTAALLALLALAVAYFARMQWTHGLEPRDGGLHAAGPAWEDQPGHTAIALGFFHGDNLHRFEYPWFAGWPLGYPFLPDFVTGMLQTFDAGLPGAVWLGMFFASVAFLLNGYVLAREWLGNRATAVLAIALALLAGSLGWWYLVGDFPADKTLAGVLRERDLANDYDRALHWHNMTTAVVLIMRTSTFGMPLAFAALLLLGRAAESREPRPAAAAAVFTAALPLIHPHSFLVIGVAAAAWLFIWRAWSRRIAAAWLLPLLFAVPQLLWTRGQVAQSTQPFLRLQPGWMCPKDTSLLYYWWMNGGVLLPFALLAWALAPARLKKFTAPFFIVFAAAVTVVFQPNDYDNIKLLAFCTLGFALAAAALLVRVWQRGLAGKIAAPLVALGISAGGICSVVHEWYSSWRIAEPEGIAFAEKVRSFTPPDALLLTGSRATHPAFFLGGRRVFLGFHNWIGQHGMPIEPRRSEVREIYSAGPRAEELLRRHGLRWVIIGPPEREEFPELKEEFFRERAEESATVGGYEIYRLRQ